MRNQDSGAGSMSTVGAAVRAVVWTYRHPPRRPIGSSWLTTSKVALAVRAVTRRAAAGQVALQPAAPVVGAQGREHQRAALLARAESPSPARCRASAVRERPVGSSEATEETRAVRVAQAAQRLPAAVHRAPGEAAETVRMSSAMGAAASSVTWRQAAAATQIALPAAAAPAVTGHRLAVLEGLEMRRPAGEVPDPLQAPQHVLRGRRGHPGRSVWTDVSTGFADHAG